ncbi:DNA polymerase III subunit delta' [Sulfurimonas sp. MAG313]|nr:DNA polymerase III subunit delta' [Sulfurimonas sp. MAG313]MDF1879717.1 DNA polymerase III subunit delta' [Sulfurimonas sp. MAG313]
MSELTSSHIIISDSVEEEVQVLKDKLYPQRVVPFYKDDFLIDDARLAIKEAYIAEAKVKTIILAGKTFNEASQNALLKVLEEPPLNIDFVIIAESKSALLPTVRSRLPLISRTKKKEALVLELSLKKLELSSLFDFIKEHERTPKHEAKELIQALYNKAMEEEIMLNVAQLNSFEMAYKLVGLNARINSVLSMLLMKFIRR